MVTSFLRQICKEGDSPEHHREIDYDSFLQIQLDLLSAIIETEELMSELKKENLSEDLEKIELLKKRRCLLKLLGTAVAWILLEFNRPYIRNLARGHDPGFITNKEGLRAELVAMKGIHNPKEGRTALLHDITNCLRVGDLSVIEPNAAYPIEIKLVKRRRKLSRRERRQRQRMKILKEYYYKGESTKMHPGLTTVRRIIERRDKHNWEEIVKVIKEAEEKGFYAQLVEKCLIYTAWQKDQPNEAIGFIKKCWERPLLTFGCLDKHIHDLPTILPLPVFEIPFNCKLKLILGEINFCVLLNLNSLCNVLEEKGFDCVVKERPEGIIQITDQTGKECIIGWRMIRKLLYECLSTKTLLNYTEDVFRFVKSQRGDL